MSQPLEFTLCTPPSASVRKADSKSQKSNEKKFYSVWISCSVVKCMPPPALPPTFRGSCTNESFNCQETKLRSLICLKILASRTPQISHTVPKNLISAKWKTKMENKNKKDTSRQHCLLSAWNLASQILQTRGAVPEIPVQIGWEKLECQKYISYESQK